MAGAAILPSLPAVARPASRLPRSGVVAAAAPPPPPASSRGEATSRRQGAGQGPSTSRGEVTASAASFAPTCPWPRTAESYEAAAPSVAGGGWKAWLKKVRPTRAMGKKRERERAVGLSSLTRSPHWSPSADDHATRNRHPPPGRPSQGSWVADWRGSRASDQGNGGRGRGSKRRERIAPGLSPESCAPARASPSFSLPSTPSLPAPGRRSRPPPPRCRPPGRLLHRRRRHLRPAPRRHRRAPVHHHHTTARGGGGVRPGRVGGRALAVSGPVLKGRRAGACVLACLRAPREVRVPGVRACAGVVVVACLFSPCPPPSVLTREQRGGF